MKRAADSLSKAPPHSFRNSSRLVGGSKNTLHRDDRGKVQVILSERDDDLSDREDNGSRGRDRILHFTIHLNNFVLFLFLFLFHFIFFFLFFVHTVAYHLKALFFNHWWNWLNLLLLLILFNHLPTVDQVVDGLPTVGTRVEILPLH